ncbi:hypothetical protein ACN20G_07365 [Streptomyces sp. BI20]|uniref:hypothetical protein n=1 Tax=Streptomyces sp. BI20 TaxID=3403460 RepID=UPI003C7507B7
MSNYQFHSGSGDNNITYHGSDPAAGTDELIARLLAEIASLRAGTALPDTAGASLDHSREVLEADDASPRERRGALASVAAIATAVGAIGAPALALAQQLLTTLG